jgi:hypothetical protein
MSQQCQTAPMNLMFIMSCSSIDIAQTSSSYQNQDSSLKALLLPRNSTFGACSCRPLHLKTVSLTIRCGSTSKQGSQKQQIDHYQGHAIRSGGRKCGMAVIFRACRPSHFICPFFFATSRVYTSLHASSAKKQTTIDNGNHNSVLGDIIMVTTLFVAGTTFI